MTPTSDPASHLDTMQNQQLLLLQTIPWALHPKNDEICINEKDLNIEQIKLLDGISKSGLSKYPISAFSHIGDDRQEIIVYSISAPSYKDDAHHALWDNLYPAALRRFETEMAELASLPWLPKPAGLTSLVINGPFILPADSLNDQQKALVDQHLGKRVDLLRGPFWDNTYIFKGARDHIGKSDSVRGAHIIQTSIDIRRGNFHTHMAELPWRLMQDGYLYLDNKDINSHARRVAERSDKEADSTALALPNSALSTPLGQSQLILKFNDSGDKYWSAGDFMGGNNAYLAILASVFEREKAFLARFTDPDNHVDSTSSNKLFEEAVALGFCSKKGKKFLLTNKLLKVWLPTDAGIDYRETYDSATKSILKNPQLFGLSECKPLTEVALSGWSRSYESFENKASGVSIKCNDWQIAPYFYQVKDQVEEQTKLNIQNALAKLDQYLELPWKLYFRPEFNYEEKFSLLLPDSNLITEDHKNLIDELVRHEYLPGRIISYEWPEVSERIEIQLKASIDGLLDQLVLMPFMPSSVYGSWTLLDYELTPQQRDVVKELENSTNLISFNTATSEYIVYDKVPDEFTERTGRLPFDYVEKIIDNYCIRIQPASVEISSEILGLGWKFGNSKSEIALPLSAFGDADITQFPQPPFELKTGSFGSDYGQHLCINKLGTYTIHVNPKNNELRKAWFDALKPEAEKGVDELLKTISALPWQKIPDKDLYALSSLEVAGKDGKVLSRLASFIVTKKSPEFSNVSIFSIPGSIYRRMHGMSGLEDLKIPRLLGNHES